VNWLRRFLSASGTREQAGEAQGGNGAPTHRAGVFLLQKDIVTEQILIFRNGRVKRKGGMRLGVFATKKNTTQCAAGLCISAM
jgi:hypothetical protein